MSKILYLIPGFGEDTKLEKYSEVKNIFKKQKFKIIPIKITWKYKTMSDYVREFLKQYKQHSNSDDVYILGFSYGAIISIIVSTQVHLKAQFVCSLSPFFKEDLPTIKERRKRYIGLKRLSDFESLSFNQLAKNITCKTYIFAGTKEWPEVEKRAKNASKLIKNNELFMIDGAKHDIWQKVYLELLQKVIFMI